MVENHRPAVNLEVACDDDDADLRREILGALVDLAAADSSISLAETNLLRQITKSLGLSRSALYRRLERYGIEP